MPAPPPAAFSRGVLGCLHTGGFGTYQRDSSPKPASRSLIPHSLRLPFFLDLGGFEDYLKEILNLISEEENNERASEAYTARNGFPNTVGGARCIENWEMRRNRRVESRSPKNTYLLHL